MPQRAKKERRVRRNSASKYHWNECFAGKRGETNRGVYEVRVLQSVRYTRGAGERKYSRGAHSAHRSWNTHSGTALCVDSSLHSTIVRYLVWHVLYYIELLHPGFVEQSSWLKLSYP